MKKAVNIFTVILAAAAFILMGRAGLRFYRFSSEYAGVWNVHITSEEVGQLEAERSEAAARLAAVQEELARLTEERDLLSAAELAGAEEQIRVCYVAREEAELAARSLVAQALEEAHYVTLTPEQQESLGDVLIDEVTGNAILAGSVKAALQAASEGRTLEDIVSDAVGGAVSGVSDYVQDEIQGAVTDVIGIDIFGVADIVSGVANASDVPTTLINSMVAAQRQDVSRLAALLEKEELTGADISAMAALMERISERGQEIAAAGGEVGDFGGAKQVAHLAEFWTQNNYEILEYAGMGGQTGEE